MLEREKKMMKRKENLHKKEYGKDGQTKIFFRKCKRREKTMKREKFWRRRKNDDGNIKKLQWRKRKKPHQ